MNSETLDAECSSSSAAASTETETNNQNNIANVDTNQKQTNLPQTPAQPGSSGTNADSSVKPVQTNLQRIKQQKQDVYNWPKNKKLLKLAMYSSCQVIYFVQYDFKTIHNLYYFKGW